MASQHDRPTAYRLLLTLYTNNLLTQSIKENSSNRCWPDGPKTKALGVKERGGTGYVSHTVTGTSFSARLTSAEIKIHPSSLKNGCFESSLQERPPKML